LFLFAIFWFAALCQVHSRSAKAETTVHAMASFAVGDFFSYLPCSVVPIHWAQLWQNTLFADWADMYPVASKVKLVAVQKIIRGGVGKTYVRVSLQDLGPKGKEASMVLERTHWLHRIRRVSKSMANLELQISWIHNRPCAWLKVRRPIGVNDELSMHWVLDNEEEIIKVFSTLGIQ
jgi:hypothetical protein